MDGGERKKLQSVKKRREKETREEGKVVGEIYQERQNQGRRANKIGDLFIH
ncbi:hypothetical protein MtrunA17_Chr2g0314251 [Medicago truncatula]|uniref:Uncharacterized protein n=1 Tax=Medicago truncatula TaxID=3880 RepID=A0A396J954_MEDTR|nr:hypothetical protein MtrunA17_Chr2g0314251 [Medicago truncatula]